MNEPVRANTARGDPAAAATPQRGSRLGRIGLWMVLAGLLAMACAALGYRLGWLPLQLSLLTLLPLGLVIVAVGTVLCLVLVIVGLARGGGKDHSTRIAGPLAGAVIGAIAVLVPVSMLLSAQGAPRIHDVTTDLVNPPQFIEAVPLREKTGARNPPEYERLSGSPPNQINVPEAQRKAFPDIVPLVLPGVAPDEAFKRALAAVDAMGWSLIAARPEEGRIEASDETFWFGFIDDVAIRVTPAANGSRIDVRSLSRVGGGDAGTNAKRVRAYIAAVKS